MNHTPTTLPDGEALKFLVAPASRPPSVPTAALFLLCSGCGALYLDPDERRDFGLTKKQAVGHCTS